MNDESNASALQQDLEFALRRFWSGRDAVNTPIWEAPDIYERYENCRTVAVDDWVNEAVFQLLEVDNIIDSFLPDGRFDSGSTHEILFHIFSLLGYHLLGVLYSEALDQRALHMREEDETNDEEQAKPPSALLDSFMLIRKALYSVASFRNLGDDEFYREFPRWVVAVLRSLLDFVDEELSFSPLSWPLTYEE